VSKKAPKKDKKSKVGYHGKLIPIPVCPN
jgi:hypothetical protein